MLNLPLKSLTKRLLLALLCLAAALPLQAARKGLLTGIVLDTKGNPVPAAYVFWQEADGKSPHALRTDKKGRFRTRAITAGLYELRPQAGGMWSEWEHNVLVPAGPGRELTLRLVRQTPPPAPLPAKRV